MREHKLQQRCTAHFSTHDEAVPMLCYHHARKKPRLSGSYGKFMLQVGLSLNPPPVSSFLGVLVRFHYDSFLGGFCKRRVAFSRRPCFFDLQLEVRSKVWSCGFLIHVRRLESTQEPGTNRGPERPHTVNTRIPTNHGFWDPIGLEPSNSNVEPLCVCGPSGP